MNVNVVHHALHAHASIPYKLYDTHQPPSMVHGSTDPSWQITSRGVLLHSQRRWLNGPMHAQERRPRNPLAVTPAGSKCARSQAEPRDSRSETRPCTWRPKLCSRDAHPAFCVHRRACCVTQPSFSVGRPKLPEAHPALRSNTLRGWAQASSRCRTSLRSFSNCWTPAFPVGLDLDCDQLSSSYSCIRLENLPEPPQGQTPNQDRGGDDTSSRLTG